MATVLRDFKDFKKFPGTSSDDQLFYKFPVLYSIDVKNRTRIWKLFIILTKKKDCRYKHNWSVDDVIKYRIDDSYFKSNTVIPESYMALIYNEQGIKDMKVSRYPPTEVLSGSKGLIGKANSRNTLTQALIDARSQYQKKIDDGYSTDPTVKKTSKDLYYAMAAQKYDIDKLSFPCYSQPKLDGVRCLTAYVGDKIIKYTRDQNLWLGYDMFNEVLMPIFNKYPHLVLDGELYIHGKPLQEIVGVARNATKKFQLEYHVYDIIVQDTPFCERVAIMNEIFKLMSNNSYTCDNTTRQLIYQVPTILVKNIKGLNNHFAKYISDGYEGQMIRMSNTIYETSKNREIRSKNLLKRKQTFDAEFEFIGVTQGVKGRAKGTFIGIFKTDKNKTFNATPKDMSMNDMIQLYNQVSQFKSDYIGKFATIEYEDLSKAGKPLRPKFVRFRDGND
jgi:ATP-dependent DNA ligase